MASKVKNMRQRCNFLVGGEGKSTVRDMALLSLGNLEAKFPKMSFSHFKTYFTQIDCCHL